MNNPNPFVPQGSLLEQQSKRRSRLKLGVFCVLAVGIAGLAAILIQGCKREQDQNQPDMGDNNQPAVDTNSVSETDTNTPPTEDTNTAPAGVTQSEPQQGPPSPAPEPAPAPVPAPEPAPATVPTESEYVVVRGDTFSKIAKENGVTVRAIEDANPGITPTRLKVGEKIVIPAGATGATAAAETANGVATAGGDEVYVVKSGDTLTRIGHHFGVTVKALEAENNLSTTRIKVGEKLNIPAKPEAEPAPVNAPPATTTAPDTASPPAPATPANPPPAQPSGNTGQ